MGDSDDIGDGVGVGELEVQPVEEAEREGEGVLEEVIRAVREADGQLDEYAVGLGVTLGGFEGEVMEVEDTELEEEGVCEAWEVTEELPLVSVGEEDAVKDTLDPDGVKDPVLVKLWVGEDEDEDVPDGVIVEDTDMVELDVPDMQPLSNPLLVELGDSVKLDVRD